MKGILKISSMIIPLIFFLSPHAFSFEGPLQVNNLFPIFLHADQPYLEKAGMESAMSYSLSHSSTYTVQASGKWDIYLDMEITALNFRYKRIIKDVVEFDMDVPVLIIGGGFMDGILADYHSAFGFPDYGRSARPNNDFLCEVRRDDNLIIKGRSGIRLGDVRGYEKLDLKNFVYGGAGVEAYIGRGVSFLVQLQGQSPVYPETDLLAVDRDAYLLVIGGRYKTGKRSFDLSLTEDINTSGAPDFILNLTYKLNL